MGLCHGFGVAAVPRGRPPSGIGIGGHLAMPPTASAVVCVRARDTNPQVSRCTHIAAVIGVLEVPVIGMGLCPLLPLA
jgi:hypothetical protein